MTKRIIIFILAIFPAVAIVRPADWGRAGSLFHSVSSAAIAITRDGPIYPVTEEFKGELFDRYPEATFIIPPGKVAEISSAINSKRSEDTAISIQVGQVRDGHQLVEVRYDAAVSMHWERYEAMEKTFLPLEQAKFSILTLGAIVSIALCFAVAALRLEPRMISWKRRMTNRFLQ